LPIFLFLFKGMAPWFKSEALWIESWLDPLSYVLSSENCEFIDWLFVC
jgi:hypothetical protein